MQVARKLGLGISLVLVAVFALSESASAGDGNGEHPTGAAFPVVASPFPVATGSGSDLPEGYYVTAQATDMLEDASGAVIATRTYDDSTQGKTIAPLNAEGSSGSAASSPHH